MNKNEYTVTLGGKTLTVYSIAFKSECVTVQTPTLNSGIFSSTVGARENFYTIKGRVPYSSFNDYAAFINSLIGDAAALSINGSSIPSLIMKSGQCEAAEDGMCHYTITLEVSTDG